MAEQSSSQAAIHQLMSFIPARAILAAAKLGLADRIDLGGTTAAQLAEALQLAPDPTYRLLRMLAAAGFVREEEGRTFALTALGQTLRRDAPESVLDYAVYINDFIYEGFAGLDETVRTGAPAFNASFGRPFFDYLQENPDRAAVFHAGIGNRGRIEARAVVEAYDFSGVRTVVDVGGGNGSFLSAILSANATVSGVLVDRAAALEAARAGRGGELPRCQFIDADIFAGVPGNFDTYTLKRLLFDFSDEDATRILRNCREAIRSDGRLLLIEVLQGPTNRPDLSHSMDLLFLVMLGGKTRSAEDYASLLRQTGFNLMRTIPTGSDLTILEAKPD